MMVTVLLFTVAGSYIASLVPSRTMGSFSVIMTFLLGVKFIVRPVMTTKEAMLGVSAKSVPSSPWSAASSSASSVASWAQAAA